LGADFPFRQLYERKQAYVDTMIEQGIPTKPGLLPLLDFIESQSLPKAVATSTARLRATQKLTLTHLLHRFEASVCGDEIPNGKPAPDIFLTAAQKLATPHAQCLVFEDSEAGIRAAHAADMVPIMVPDLKQPAAEIKPLAYQILTSLHEAIPLLQSLL
jgi:HAD superfamily hydrolase (TIGR01509 family)